MLGPIWQWMRVLMSIEFELELTGETGLHSNSGWR